ncbi:MAG: histidinol-phosphate transaminase [Ruminococcaceae bacterium]|nr:histidinol-phosphate transaminase [Oscillospiraceae bacterium]
MSKYFSQKYKSLVPYVPGEQPKDNDYIKLNTNESPYPPSEKAVKLAGEYAKKLHLYPDPTCGELVKQLSEMLGVGKDQVLLTNGSDEILNFAFMAYCDDKTPAVFPEITYGFYKVFAQINNLPYEEIPLNEDFTINVEDYIGVNKTVFIANPNAPTGIALPLSDIERIVSSNPDNVVVIDEAYVDFGCESAVALVDKYPNLLVTQTFSKSRSMAGARLGFGIGSKELIADLNAVKYSTNPYNINSMTMAAGIGCLSDDEYTKANCLEIQKNREYTKAELEKLGFTCTDSKTNFIFAKSDSKTGEEIYQKLRENGILVRHFSDKKIADYNRITIGSREQMEKLVSTLSNILR